MNTNIKNRIYRLFLISIISLLPQMVLANNNNQTKSSAQINLLFEKAYSNFKLGEYDDAILKINQLEKFARSKNKRQLITNAHLYIKAQSYKMLQEYEKAIDIYNKIISNRVFDRAVYFDLAQSYYAINNLRKAKDYFLKAAKHTKKYESIYYVAYIYMLLEQYKKANKYFAYIISHHKYNKNGHKEVNIKIVQASVLQYNQSLHYIYQKKYDKKEGENPSNDLIKKIKLIITSLMKGISLNVKSNSAKDMKGLIKSLRKEYGLDPNQLSNGRKLASKRFNLSAGYSFSYDSNVTLQNDFKILNQSTSSASLFKSVNIYTSYLFSFAHRYLFKPSLSFSNNDYVNKTNPDIYSNNSDTTSLGFENTYEHNLFNNTAGVSLNYSFDYLKRDYQQIHSNKYYAKSQSLTLKERIDCYFGTTGLSYKYNFYGSYNSINNNNTHSFIIEQNINLPKNSLGNQNLSFFIENDLSNSYNATINSFNSYLLKTTYTISIDDITLDFGFGISIVNPLYQRDTRGIEKTYTPSLKLSRKVGLINTSISHEFTQNNSKDTNYQYTKNITKIDFSMLF